MARCFISENGDNYLQVTWEPDEVVPATDTITYEISNAKTGAVVTSQVLPGDGFFNFYQLDSLATLTPNRSYRYDIIWRDASNVEVKRCWGFAITYPAVQDVSTEGGGINWNECGVEHTVVENYVVVPLKDGRIGPGYIRAADKGQRPKPENSSPVPEGP